MADVVDADSQLSAHLQGLLFLGHGCGQAPGEHQGSFRLGEVLGVDAVIAGSVEESDTMGLGSAENTQGTDHTVAGAANHSHTAQSK